jgi:hypothetical protein
MRAAAASINGNISRTNIVTSRSMRKGKNPASWYYRRIQTQRALRGTSRGSQMTTFSTGGAMAAAALAATLMTHPSSAAEQIKVVERPVGETNIDLTAKGDSVGDMLVFANGVFDAANKTQIGTDQGYCIRTIVGKTWECFWTLTLKSGQSGDRRHG